jgi:hypothetical protein
MLAARATSHLRQVIRTGGDLDLMMVPCSCRPGTEGVTSRERIEKLFNEGKSEQDVLAAKPLADLDAKWAANEQQAQNWTRMVYNSFSGRNNGALRPIFNSAIYQVIDRQ